MAMAMLVAIIVSIAIIAGETPVSAEDDGGQCGDNLEWSYSANVLTISLIDSAAQGSMYDFEEGGAPWYENRAFITTLNLPSDNKLKRIGDYAFYGCDKIVNPLYLDNSVVEIGDYAFYGCTGLPNVHLSNNFGGLLERIGDYAFYGCTGINNNDGDLKITVNTQIIGDYAFAGCTGSFRVFFCVEEEGSDITLSIGNHAFEGCTNFDLWGSTNSINVKQTVSIGDYAFYGCKSLRYPFSDPNANDKLKYIGEYAFYGCTSMANVLKIDTLVESIGAHAFEGCTGLTGLQFGGTDVKSIGEYAFNGCTSMAGGLQIPAKVESIGKYAFNGCSSLTGLAITDTAETPSVLESIGEYAFNGCTSMAGGLQIPSTVESIGESAFQGCFTQSSPDPDNPYRLILGESLKTMGPHAFDGCKGISDTLAIPSSLTAIREYTFNGCTGLTGLTIAEDAALEAIGECAFAECTALTGNLTIPPSVVSIGDGAFKKTYLASVTFSDSDSNPSRLETIGAQAFHECGHMNGVVTIPASVITIGDFAFGSCYILDGVQISDTTDRPSNLRTIGRYAFQGGSSEDFGALNIPASVESIGENAFSHRTLTSLTIAAGSVPLTIERDVFNTTKIAGTLTIPARVTSIGEFAFYHCRQLTWLEFSESETNSAVPLTIGANAFNGCTALEATSAATLSIPDRTTYIGSCAFQECFKEGGPIALIIGANVEMIESEAFNGCSKIASIEFAEGSRLAEIRDRAFKDSGAQGNLSLPQTLVFIGESVFQGCFTQVSPDLDHPYKLTLGESLKTISKDVFNGCTGFTFAYTEEEPFIPKSLNYIGQSAFMGSGIAGEVICGESMDTIFVNAFNGCTGITKLYISQMVKKVGFNAFKGCINMTEIAVAPGATGIDAGALPDYKFFKDTSMTVEISTDSAEFPGFVYDLTPGETLKCYRAAAIKIFTVTYDIAGGTGDAPVQPPVEAGEMITVLGYTGTKEGYEYSGWLMDGIVYLPGTVLDMPERNLEFVAIWTPLHPVTYYAVGGSQIAPTQDPVPEGKEFTVADYEGKKSGFGFNGWLFGDVIYKPGQTLTMGGEEVVFTAVWDAIRNVSYDIDGGSGAAPLPQQVLEGAKFTMPQYKGEKEGYDFAGWLYDGKIYSPGDKVIMGEKDIVVLAKWYRVHHVTYDLDGGKGEAPEQPDVREGESFTIKACTATKDGYWLSGWTYGGLKYREGDSITMGEDDIVLKAVWMEGGPSHSVTYDVDGGSTKAPVQADVQEGFTFVVKYYSGTKGNLVFHAWDYQGKEYHTGDVITMGTEDIKLSIIWTEKKSSGNSILLPVLIAAGVAALTGTAIWFVYYARRLRGMTHYPVGLKRMDVTSYLQFQVERDGRYL